MIWVVYAATVPRASMMGHTVRAGSYGDGGVMFTRCVGNGIVAYSPLGII